MNGSKIGDQRIVVEKAGKRKTQAERRLPNKEDECFHCKRTGHWLIK